MIKVISAKLFFFCLEKVLKSAKKTTANTIQIHSPRQRWPFSVTRGSGERHKDDTSSSGARKARSRVCVASSPRDDGHVYESAVVEGTVVRGGKHGGLFRCVSTVTTQ